MKHFLITVLTRVFLLLMCQQCIAAGEFRALLVGVSEYPSLDLRYQLQGPRNDVQRMRDVLLKRGFPLNNLTILADGVDGAQDLPTRGQILAALNDLYVRSGGGDYVVIYFAGHGSQQPANRASKAGRNEADGLFETFLPRDVGVWKEGKQTVENALIDFEIRQVVDRILAKGAFVWGIFDSCHSATLVRSLQDSTEQRYRYVMPESLGVPISAINHTLIAEQPSRSKVGVGQSSSLASGMRSNGSVFFYAAQTTELAPELRLPIGHPERKPFGLFGFTLMQALESGIPMSYRQLGQYVLSQYGSMNQMRVTPMFAGDSLDSAVLGQNALPVRQWPLEIGSVVSLPVGALSGITQGSVFALVRSPLDNIESALGYLQANHVALENTVLVPLLFKGKPVVKLKKIPLNAYARLVSSTLQFSLRVAVDYRSCIPACPASQIIAALQKSGVSGVQINWLNPNEIGDVAIKLYPTHAQLLPPDLQGIDCASRKLGERKQCSDEMRRGSIPLLWKPSQGFDALHNKIAIALHSVARSTNLMRIANQLNARALKSKLTVALKHTPKSGGVFPLSFERSPILMEGDKVTLELNNTGKLPVDVTVLYLDSSYGVAALFPINGGVNRLEVGADISLEIAIDDSTVGIERLLIIAVEAKSLSERADFSFLTQPALMQANLRGLDAPEDDDISAFRDAGFANHSFRGNVVVPAAISERTTMQVFNWSVRALK